MKKDNITGIIILLAICIAALLAIIHSSPETLSVNSEYNEVIEFLLKDPTDSNEYNDGYDCENFAKDVQSHAKEHELSCAYVMLTSWSNTSHFHAIVAFRIDNKTLFFEPQTDAQIYPAAEDIYSISWSDKNE